MYGGDYRWKFPLQIHRYETVHTYSLKQQIKDQREGEMEEDGRTNWSPTFPGDGDEEHAVEHTIA
jgi:hypothetical protein